ASIPSFPELISVGDDLCIEDTEAMTEIKGFGKLTFIGDDLDIRDNSALLHVSGFESLETIIDRWDFEDNDVLVSIPIFPSLQQVGAFEFDNNDAFVNLSGFPALTLIAGKSSGSPDAVEIEDNASLKYISGLNALTKVDFGDGDENFSIQRNPSLLEITGFQQLAEVVDDFIIVDNADLKYLNGFNQLMKVGSDLRIRFNSSLQEILGFKVLQFVGGNLSIEDNPELKSLGPFSKLQHVEDRLRIVGNLSLEKINGFNALSFVGENIRIGMNDALTAIKGFDGITQIGDNLRIANNAALEFIYAFKNLGIVTGTLTILNNPSLFFCCGLTKVISEAGYGAINVAGNAPGCNSVMEILAVCDATLSDCTPNCKASINAGVNRDGLAILRPSDWVTDTTACSSGLEITIETTWGGPIFGPQVIGMNGAFAIHACPFLFQTLKIKTRSASGTCWTDLTLKQGNGPTIDPIPAETVYCTDDLVSGPDPSIMRTAWIPCSEEVPAEFVTDWVTPIDCEPGVIDTVKIIYREWEAYDKDGRRGVRFDTLYVLQFPEITAASIYCERKDTTYCGDTTVAIGPYIVYPDLAGGCDTTYLVNVSDLDNDQMLEFNPTVFANKCGINVHVDAWKFPGDCEIQYRVQVDIKQECYGPAQTMCIVPPAGVDPNFAEQLGPGYWRCEFWVVDIDTLGPEVVCKGDELFDGPFAIENWELVAGLVNPLVFGPTIAQTHSPELDYFNLDNLPYSLIIESEIATEFQDDFALEINTDDLDLSDPDDEGGEEAIIIEPDTEESIFFIAPYKAQAAAIYRATEDTEFNFVWDFTLEPQDDMLIFGANTEAFKSPFDACVTIAYYVNGVGYRMVQGEEGPCGFIEFTDLQANHSMGVSLLDPVTVGESQFGRANIPLRAGDELIILALWDSNAKATLRIMGQNQASTSKTECAAHAYIPPLKVVDDWSGAKQAKATVEGYGDVELKYNPETGCFESHLSIKFPFRYEPYKINYEAFDSCHNVSYDSCYLVVKDDIKPVPVIDKGVTVSLSDKKVWLDAESFDEGSSDNCGVNLLLVRRNDWYKSCVDLCNDLEYICVNEHEDTLWRAVLEADKNIDPVEAHYRKTLEWLATDERPCAELIYNAWQYDLIKHAMQECFEHPYAIDDHAIRELILECSYHLDDYFKAVPIHPGDDLFSARFTPSLLDTYQQIGGGWSDAVAFSCEDACGPVTIEILVMDYWCNWATAWTEVWVEDKTPVKVVKDVVDIDEENTISCKTYRENRYSY
ncbi:MAG: hypothetical protein OEM26_14960, partial [Saprospiraceae bacterium]|nr:hypothetical protein [Saprospiraceae bacterium]